MIGCTAALSRSTPSANAALTRTVESGSAGEEVGLEVACILGGDEGRELLDNRLFLRRRGCRSHEEAHTEAQRNCSGARHGVRGEQPSLHDSLSSEPL